MAIVVPIVPDASEHALRTAVDICRITDQPLVALFASPVSATNQDELDAQVDAMSDLLDQEDIAYSIEVRLDDAELASIISDVAAQVEASLVVVSAAQRLVGSKLLLGAQLQRLLVDSPCSILVVREPTHPAVE